MYGNVSQRQHVSVPKYLCGKTSKHIKFLARNRLLIHMQIKPLKIRLEATLHQNFLTPEHIL